MRTNTLVKRAILDYQRDIVIYRNAGGAWDLVTGKFNRDNSTIINTKAVVEKPNDKEVMLVPEGERSKTLISVWCLESIYQTDSGSDYSDIIEFGGRQYRVLSVNDRYLGQYHKAICGGIPA